MMRDPVKGHAEQTAVSESGTATAALVAKKLASAAGLPRPDQVSLVCSHQEECWQQGERPLLEEYLEQLAGLRDDAGAFLYLVIHEVCLREQHGERASLDEYLKRFPALDAPLRREFAARQATVPGSDDALPPRRNAVASDDTVTLPPGDPPDRCWPSSLWNTIGKPEGSSAAPSRISVTGYEVLGELGRGGMGVVYKARHVGLNRLVALKMILAAEHAGAEGLARFRIEAEAVARLQHPNIVQIYEIGSQDGRPFFSLEFVDGGSLEGKMASSRPARSPAWSSSWRGPCSIPTSTRLFTATSSRPMFC